MKRVLFIAAMLCGVSFASNAATAEIKTAAVEKKTEVSKAAAKPAAVCQLFEETFECPAQGWSIPVVGHTQQEVTNALKFYHEHLAC